MPKVFADFQQGVDARTQDKAAKLDGNSRDQCIREALTGRYSLARPVAKVKDLTGDGVLYKWTLNTTNFPGWVEDWSTIRDLEYPAAEATEREPETLAKEEWITVRVSNTARDLRLTSLTPSSGKKLRVHYTALHLEDGTDVPDGDFEGVVNLAGHIACQRLAAIYTQLGDATLGADAVDYGRKADTYRELAKIYEERFKELFGTDVEEQQPAASATVEWPVKLEDGGGRLTH
jgi:hypothetical protein